MRKIRRERGQPEGPDATPLEQNLIRPEEEEKKTAVKPGEPTWSDFSTWTLSMRFAPAAVIALGCFIAIYYQHFFGDQSLDMTSWGSCMASFPYGINMAGLKFSVETLPSHSWEYGTAAEALLELFTPERSVFSPSAFPHGNIPPNPWYEKVLDELSWAVKYIDPNGPVLYYETTAVSDPASLGISAILVGQRSKIYLDAAHRQRDFLLNEAPRYSNGAISHRSDNAELWSDAIAMFPPFLAYCAVESKDTTLMKETVNQIRLYHDVLAYKDGPRKSLWKHIVGSSIRSDDGAWSTGNAWAAFGMARVRATLTHWPSSNDTLKEEKADLDQWIDELIGAVVKWDNDDSGLLRNYIDDKSWFGETSGTALMAATVYRMAVMQPDVFGKYTTWAHQKRQVVLNRADKDGMAQPAVNSLEHLSRKPVQRSAEGQAFVLMMLSAWRDCVCARVCTSDLEQRYDIESQGTSAKSEL